MTNNILNINIITCYLQNINTYQNFLKLFTIIWKLIVLHGWHKNNYGTAIYRFLTKTKTLHWTIYMLYFYRIASSLEKIREEKRQWRRRNLYTYIIIHKRSQIIWSVQMRLPINIIRKRMVNGHEIFIQGQIK